MAAPKDVKVYKDQCAFCFVTPEFPNGILICVNHKLAFCADHVQLHLAQSPTCLRFVEYVRRKKLKQSDVDAGQPVPKITKLAIGIEGGCVGDQYESIEKWAVYDNYPEPSSKKLISDQDSELKAIMDAQSIYRLRELESMASVWDGSLMVTTKHKNLKQLPFQGKVPKSGWTCQAEGGCDKKENLWINLTDGKILCGRRYANGSGGNNHAVQYYERTGFPLAVNLGTITPAGADVYSYDEDEMVIDPNLYHHLAHFGIDMLQMEKTEKTILEKDLDLNVAFESRSILEEGKELKPIFGPGFVGIHNIGNSCYMNSLLQAIFQAHPIAKAAGSKTFEECTGNPYEDFKVQAAKIFAALASPIFSVPPEELYKEDGFVPLENGIKPHDFRYVCGKGHREFATKKQQDVEEYAHHLSNLMRLHFGTASPFLSLNHVVRVTPDGGSPFFKLQCVYDVLFDAQKIADLSSGMDPSSPNRPKFNLLARIREIVENPKSAVLGCVSHMCNFPPYLLIKVNRHSHSFNNKPIKLNYILEVDPEMDLNFLRVPFPDKTGQIIIEGQSDKGKTPPVSPALAKKADAAVSAKDVASLTEMGFTEVAAKKALRAVNSNVNSAIEWLLERAAQPGLDEPEPEPTSEPGGSAAKGSEKLFDKPADLQNVLQKMKESDGSGVYKLAGVISHIGASTDTGHYVYHGFKDGKWIIYNDEKVALSEKPPIESGYLYLFERKT